jgi:flagellar operon protein
VARIQGVLNGPGPASGSSKAIHKPAGAGEDFRKLLDDLGKPAGIRFSRHAAERISARGISMDSGKLNKLDAAVNAAGSKGARESLVLMDELALVVSVKNRTVITAMSSEETKGNVFTSIDSTVIA